MSCVQQLICWTEVQNVILGLQRWATVHTPVQHLVHSTIAVNETNLDKQSHILLLVHKLAISKYKSQPGLKHKASGIQCKSLTTELLRLHKMTDRHTLATQGRRG